MFLEHQIILEGLLKNYVTLKTFWKLPSQELILYTQLKDY